jgi:predicted XRE-type DNA-binding protein
MAIDRPDTEQNIEFEIGSGNVFADIGFDNAEEMLLKSELVRQVNRTIQDRDLNSIQVKKTLNLDENMLSNLAQGRLTELTIENLFRYLNILGRDLEIVLKPRSASSSKGKLKVTVI